jgi:bis(5'-adenosyl)-triphosphatase
VVNRFLDLTSEEVSDLWLTAKYVGQKLEPFYNASSLTFTIQDGPKAGQTVPHVHVHILPRKDGDFENNDEIYDVIDEKEKELAKKLNLDLERKDRTFEEMANEAANLRALFWGPSTLSNVLDFFWATFLFSDEPLLKTISCPIPGSLSFMTYIKKTENWWAAWYWYCSKLWETNIVGTFILNPKLKTLIMIWWLGDYMP